MIERLLDRPDAHQFAGDPGQARVRRIDVGGWHHAAAESHLGRFTHSPRGLSHSPHLAGQADLAEHGGAGRNGPVFRA